MAKVEPKTRKAYRQGELLFLPLSDGEFKDMDANPNQATHSSWRNLNTDTLREGEATGHKHQVVTETAGVATILAPVQQFMRGLPQMSPLGTEDRLLISDEPAQIVHPEHNTLALPKGTYLVIVQREYDEVKARRVLD